MMLEKGGDPEYFLLFSVILALIVSALDSEINCGIKLGGLHVLYRVTHHHER